MSETAKSKISFYSALIVGALLRFGIAAAAFSDMMRFHRPDTLGYLEMAKALAANGDFGGLTGRVPLFPAICAAFMKFAGNAWQGALVTFLVLISVLTIWIVYRCASEFRAGCENIAVWLFALNITAIANAPMLLTDTLFLLVAALETWLIFKFINTSNPGLFIAAIAVASVGTLLRPINLLFPFCALFLLIPANLSWKKRLLTAVCALAVAGAVAVPWMIRNVYCRAGFTIDTNTGAMYHQNGAMLLAEINNSDFESEKAKLVASMAEEFSDKQKYPDEKSREAYRITQYRSLVISHPFVWMKQQLNFATLLPDAPTFLELAGATAPNRGTMGVLAKDGIFAAVKHYFGGKYYLITILLPLLCASALTIIGTVLYVAEKLRRFNKDLFVTLLLFSLLIWYYLFLPGAISAPRYHLPVLPCACTFAGCVFMKFCEIMAKLRK